jgi:hypothetical protein
VDQYQVDLFSKQETTEHDVGENGARSAASSPFLAAARLQDTGILKFFMQLWDERYGSAGRNDNGEYPIHVLCRDKHGETLGLLIGECEHADSGVVAM